MKLSGLCFKRLVPKYQVHRQILSLYPYTSRHFCVVSAPTVGTDPKPIVLRSRDSDQQQKQQEQTTSHEESIIHRRKEEEFNRKQAILAELKELKQFIEDNGDDPIAIIKRLKHEVYSFDASKSTAIHRCEAMRRILWLCTKYLSDSQWHHLAISSEIEALFTSFTQFYLDGMDWFTIEELCDILWTYSTLGFRPTQLITKIVQKIDRILYDHKTTYFGYEQLKSESANDEMDSESMEHKAKVIGYVPGSLKLPFKHNEFADIMYAFGCLRIDSGNLVSLLNAIIMEHYPQKLQHNKHRTPNRLLDGFLPRDLSNLCIGYAMMDPAFHWYPIVWGLNRHLNILSNYIQWTFEEKLNILHYDVAMRYINIGWKLQLTGEMAKLVDENFIKNLPRVVAPYYDALNQEIYDILCEQVISDQYFCKNIEGFQIPFSRWEPRDEPAVLEPLNRLQFTRLDHVNENKMLLGRSLLRQNILKCMLGSNYRYITYWEWPHTNHLQNLLIRKKIKEIDMPLTVKQNLLQHTLEPHYKPLQKGLYE